MAQRVDPGLILLDLHLPDTPGVALLQALKNRAGTRDIPVLVISAHPEQLAACADCAAGVHAKPFDVTALLEHVQRLIRSEKEAPGRLRPAGDRRSRR